MKKVYFFCVLFITLAMVPLAYAVSESAPKLITLQVPEGAKATQPSIVFPHDRHMAHAKLECDFCHHKDPEDDPSKRSCSAKGCHTDMEKKKGATSFYAAFHAYKLQSCVGCHKGAKRRGVPAGPRNCKGCHRKATQEGKPVERKGLRKLKQENKISEQSFAKGIRLLPKIDPNPVQHTNIQPVSSFPMHVGTGSYAKVRRLLNKGALPKKNDVRMEEFINYFEYNYPGPESKDTPFAVTYEIAPTVWNNATYVLRLGIKGYEPKADERPGANLVFLVDVDSAENNQDRLPMLRDAFTHFVDNLTAKDRVSIAVYGGAEGVVLEPTPGDKKDMLVASFNHALKGGSTDQGKGIELAYALARKGFIKDGINRVILTTDGDFNLGLNGFKPLVELVEKEQKEGISLSTHGFGEYDFNDEHMEVLAEKGHGNCVYVSSLNEAKRAIDKELTSVLFPIAKDVKASVEFNPALVSEYRLIGYEHSVLCMLSKEKFELGSGLLNSGHTLTVLYELALKPEKENERSLRYQDESTTREEHVTKPDELGFFKLTYLLPDSGEQGVLEVPILKSRVKQDFVKASNDFKFATTVAGFGQLLRGGKYTGDYQFSDVLFKARVLRGEDPYGFRAEIEEFAKNADKHVE